MRYLAIVVFALTIFACNEIDSNPSANIIGSLSKPSIYKGEKVDSLFLPLPGNGIKHIYPQKDFTNRYELFQELLLHFRYVELPYELDGLVVDRMHEEWEQFSSLDLKFYRFLMDKQDFQMAKSIINPLDEFESFYKIYPIAKLEEKDYYNTIIYAVRYLDGNGQQDAYYLSTFNTNGVFLSGVEIGALEASTQTHIKTAQITQDRIIKVHHADYDENNRDWVKSSESQFLVDNTGQIYLQYENKMTKASESETVSSNDLFIKMADFKNYFQLFQKEIKNNAPNTILNFLTLPHFRVSYEEHYQDIKTKEEFMSQYEVVFNESLRKKILRQEFSELIFDEDRIGLSDGSMWFKRIGRDNDGRLIVAVTVN